MSFAECAAAQHTAAAPALPALAQHKGGAEPSTAGPRPALKTATTLRVRGPCPRKGSGAPGFRPAVAAPLDLAAATAPLRRRPHRPRRPRRGWRAD